MTWESPGSSGARIFAEVRGHGRRLPIVVRATG